MSSIPKAKRSQIKNLTVYPEGWDSYPTVEHSSLTSCTFVNLAANTKIDRCDLKHVRITTLPKGSPNSSSGYTNIDRSELVECELLDANIDRSTLKQCKITNARVDRSPLNGVRVTGPGIKVERSQLNDCEVSGKSNIERTNIKNSLLEETKADRSHIADSLITQSTLDIATLTDCDVSDCKIERTTFTGMILRNGKWNNGDLVDRIDPKMEVTIIKKSSLQDHYSARNGRAQQPEQKAPALPLRSRGPPGSGDIKTDHATTQDPQTTGVVRNIPVTSAQPPSYQVDVTHRTIESGMASQQHLDSTSAVSEPGARFDLDNYEGPIMAMPPTYDESSRSGGGGGSSHGGDTTR